MKYLEEYRDGAAAQEYLAAIRKLVTRPWTLMEVCGGQTHSIVRYGLDELLPPEITLIHGPGCPVCVTPIHLIDRALAIAQTPGVIFASFGDMLRVPGSSTDLLRARAAGADVRIVYSPLDAVAIAEREPAKQVVFFAVGFETTAPANAMAVLMASRKQLTNFSILVAHVRVPPALEAILTSPFCKVQGFLAAGHVCTVMGTGEYEAVAAKYQVPIVVTGFEPVDILHGVAMVVRQLEEGRQDVEIAYGRVGAPRGQRAGAAGGGRRLRGGGPDLARAGRDPAERARRAGALRGVRRGPAVPARPGPPAAESPECIAGLVLQGIKKPQECGAFGGQVHAGAPAGRADGQLRGRLRGVLPVPAARGGGAGPAAP